MPDAFLPLPLANGAGAALPRGGRAQQQQQQQQQREPVVLAGHSPAQLLALAAQHNKAAGMPPDAFAAVLAGIPELAQLRPNSREAVTHTLGTRGLPAGSAYARAWRQVVRKGAQTTQAAKAAAASKGASGSGGGSAPAAAASAAAAAAAAPAGKDSKRLKAAAAAAPALAAAAAADTLALQLVPDLTTEQHKFRVGLAAFLGRPVDLPLLAVGAPVLDLQHLLKEVMSRGRSAQVTASDSWPTVAGWTQRNNAALGPLVAAVYDCYLEPVERVLPPDHRPARALDFIAHRTQQRAALGAGAASYEAVVFAADAAAAALARCPPDEQQQQQPCGSAKAQRELQLLRQAAVQPEVLLQQIAQHGLQDAQHAPSRAACVQDRKQLLATRFNIHEHDILVFFGEAPAKKRSGAAAGGGRRRQQQQAGNKAGAGTPPQGAAAQAAEVVAPSISPADALQLDAARWQLASLRAVRSGPPGCTKPLLQLPGMQLMAALAQAQQQRAQQKRERGSSAAAAQQQQQQQPNNQQQQQQQPQKQQAQKQKQQQPQRQTKPRGGSGNGSGRGNKAAPAAAAAAGKRRKT